jgi:enoyl-CoA hydratase
MRQLYSGAGLCQLNLILANNAQGAYRGTPHDFTSGAKPGLATSCQPGDNSKETAFSHNLCNNAAPDAARLHPFIYDRRICFMESATIPQFRDILVETPAARVGLVRLNRPQVLNALSKQLMDELMTALQAFDQNPDIGAIVLTGNEKAFSAGADISEMAGASTTDMIRRGMTDRWSRLRRINKPVIAAVSGHCLGGGCELAMTCDMIVASETAKFGQPEINIGVIPGAGGTQRLARAVGKSLAMEMVLNDRRLSAEEALRYGLVSRVTPLERYLEEAVTLAAQVASRAPLAVQLGKEAVNHAFELSLSEGLAYEQKLFYILFASEDQKEGMAAFKEKRKPAWQGR